jgi:hypothetical protein
MEKLTIVIDKTKTIAQAIYTQISDNNVGLRCSTLSDALLIAYHFRIKKVDISIDNNCEYNVFIHDIFGNLQHLVNTSRSD